MPDLSSVAAINVVLDNSGVTPLMKIIDSSAYPGGVAVTVLGYAVVTQPDGVTETHGSFGAPIVFWQSGALVQPTFFLRLANNMRFQNGDYRVDYYIRATGYTDTLLTKTFTVAYTAPTPVIAQSFDNFTPSLRCTDATSYTIAGLSYLGVNQQWTGVIRSVTGTNQNISASGATFDLAFGGSYYDSYYDVELTSIATWQIPGPSSFVTLLDKVIKDATFQAEIPPTLASLLASLTALKNSLDANLNNKSVYTAKQADYTLAASIYDHLVRRGQTGSLAGLSDYVWQLQKIFNNNVTPVYVNTNGIIPAYDFGAGTGGSTAWNSITGKPSSTIVKWTVGDVGFPGNGATSITNAGFAGFNVIGFRNGIFEPITKSSLASTTAIFGSGAIATGETFYLYTIVL